VRIWSSACSTGEEPYSLAMHALNHLNLKAPWKIQILASDINEQVLRQAQTGIYDAHRVDTIPGEYLQKYFINIGGKYRIRPEPQKLVTFRKINLKGAFPKLTRPLDMIFCRNVIIYFDKQTQAELMSRFFQCLGPGGYLFLGHSESLNGICSLYRFMSASIYRKEG
jgi:chemotaxis protein methyltransferase CheR